MSPEEVLQQSEQFKQFMDVCYAFLSIVLEGAFFIFIGTLISGFIDAYLPPGLIDKWLPKNKYAAVLLSGMLGAIFPVCECAIVPVIRRLVKKGLPLACAITYMLAAPIINPVVFFSTWAAFQSKGGIEEPAAPPKMELKLTADGTTVAQPDEPRIFKPDPWYMAISRVSIAYMITVLVGFVILKIPVGSILRGKVLAGVPPPKEKKHDHDHSHDHHDHSHDHHAHDHDHHAHDHDHEHDHDHGNSHKAEAGDQNPSTPPDDHDHAHDHGGSSQGAKLIHAMNVAQRDFRDVSIYFVVGVALTAMFNVLVDQNWIVSWAGNDWLAAPALMGLAFVLSLCSTSDALVAASWPRAIMAGPRLAFLIFGPMFDVKLLFMYSSIFKMRFILILAAALFIVTGVFCVLWTA
ncbi:MAG: uncharacterized membrane protein YraQ (UPF0718 family) [Verrucomicrobiales bacterium]|jgi:uncharacterized membrane protein YraQ (UPF0718 family)